MLSTKKHTLVFEQNIPVQSRNFSGVFCIESGAANQSAPVAMGGQSTLLNNMKNLPPTHASDCAVEGRLFFYIIFLIGALDATSRCRR